MSNNAAVLWLSFILFLRLLTAPSSCAKRNAKASYGDIKEKADKKGLTIYPIMYGRAQAQLGIVKPGAGKKKKAAAKRGPGRPRKVTGRGPGRPRKAGRRAGSGDPLAAVQELVETHARENAELRETLLSIRKMIDRIV